jgi:hypothetical protein
MVLLKYDPVNLVIWHCLNMTLSSAIKSCKEERLQVGDEMIYLKVSSIRT